MFFGIYDQVEQVQGQGQGQEQEQELGQELGQVRQGQEQEDTECPECEQEIVHICPRDPVLRYQIYPGGQWLRYQIYHGDEMNMVNIPTRQSRGEELPKSKLPEIENSFFDYDDVTLAIEDIPNGASPGPVGVPPTILKKAKVNIARMLVVIFKSSIEHGEIPEILKLAFVTPVHKGGSRAQPVQYRPISLTSHVIKVLERVLRKSLVGFLD